MESVVKKFKWPARLFLFAFAYFIIGNWIEKYSEKLNEVVSQGSFEKFDGQKYEKFNKAKTFYKYVKYLPWINTRDPQIIALGRWDHSLFHGVPNLDFYSFFSSSELYKKVYNRTQNLDLLFRVVSNQNFNDRVLSLRNGNDDDFSVILKYSDVIEYINKENPNILLNTKDSLIFVDPYSQENILITGKVKSEYLEVLSQLNSSSSYFYILDHEELFLDYELESFVLKHEHAFRTFGYGGRGSSANIFENTGERLDIYPAE